MAFLKNTLIAITLLLIGFVIGSYQYEITSKIRKLFHPTVTVLMSTYNRGNIVGSAIESILNQSYADFEFVIIDDGSDDHTADVIQKYAKKDSRIVFLKNETNKGLIYSLNRGLDIARGKYIARMDDDDFSLPWRLSRQVIAMEDHPEIIILGSHITDEKTAVYPPKTNPQIEDPDMVEIQTYAHSALAHPTIIIRRDFLNKHNIRYKSENLYAEDCGLYADVLNAGGKISQINEPLLRFAVNKNVKRPDKYYDIQFKTFVKIQKEKLNPLIDTLPKELEGPFLNKKQRCLFWHLMHKENKNKNIVNHHTLTKLLSETCPQNMEKALLTKHEYWEDFLIKESKTRYYRFQSNDYATVLNETENEIELKWDDYGIETFKKNDSYFELVSKNIK